MKHKLIVILLAILFTVNSFAEENQTSDKIIDVETAVQSALQTHLSVKQSRIQLEQAKRKYDHSWNNFLPSLSANVNGAANGSLTSTAANALTFSTGINANLNISLGVGKKIAALKADYESGQKNYEDAVREIETEIRKSFYSLLYMQGQVEISKASVSANEAQYNQTKIKKSQGLVTELDLLTSQVNYESAKINLRNTEKSYFNATFTFLNEIGINVEPGQRVSFEGSLDDYVNANDFELSQGNLDELIENSPAIRTIKSTLSKNSISRSQLALSAYLPNIMLSANINPYSYSYSLPNKIGITRDSWSVSAGLSFALDNYIPGSAVRDNIADMDDSIKTLEMQLDKKRQQIKTNIIEILNEIEIAKEGLENCRLNIDLAKKSYEMAEVAYKNGTKDLNSLQSIHNAYSNAELQYRSQQLSLINSRLTLKSLIGK
jgi:outer membrane efflux protein